MTCKKIESLCDLPLITPVGVAAVEAGGVVEEIIEKVKAEMPKARVLVKKLADMVGELVPSPTHSQIRDKK